MKLHSVVVLILGLNLAPSFSEAGVFITAGTDRSSHSYVQFYVQDSAGRRTGQPATGPQVAEIPGTKGHYGMDAVGNLLTGVSGPETVEFHTSSFPEGQFQLIVVPRADTAYWLRFDIENDNDAVVENSFSGYAVAGATVGFVFEHHPTASSPTAVSKIVIPGGLRQSIQVALQVGQLGDAAFVARLDKLLAKVETEIEKGHKKQAADRLDQFIHRLDSAFKKEPDPDDGDDPQDKKNAAEMKRFVTQAARDSLNADARTLIIGLGEQPKR